MIIFRRWRRTPSERELELETRVAKLEAELSVARLENELLAELNENLRRWVLANTATAVSVAESFGAPPAAGVSPLRSKTG